MELGAATPDSGALPRRRLRAGPGGRGGKRLEPVRLGADRPCGDRDAPGRRHPLRRAAGRGRADDVLRLPAGAARDTRGRSESRVLILSRLDGKCLALMLRSLGVYTAVLILGTGFFFFLHHIGNGLHYEQAKQRFSDDIAANLPNTYVGYVSRFNSAFTYCQISLAVIEERGGRKSPTAIVPWWMPCCQ